jgi:hypothetical protein
VKPTTVPDRVAAEGHAVLLARAGADFRPMAELVAAIREALSPGTAWARQSALQGDLRCGCEGAAGAVIPHATLAWLETWGYGRERDRWVLVGECPRCRAVYFDASR